MEIQLPCRLAGVEFPRTGWMRMCMCGPEKEMLFTSLKVGPKMLNAQLVVSNKFPNISLKIYLANVFFSVYRHPVLEV